MLKKIVSFQLDWNFKRVDATPVERNCFPSVLTEGWHVVKELFRLIISKMLIIIYSQMSPANLTWLWLVCQN